jgi:alkylation response protein AidB-like acyl-CoA dehydrogenase
VQCLGCAQQALDMTVDYVSRRVQFGQPIGSFQAVQHHCANMATWLRGMRNLTYRAAWSVGQESPDARTVSRAKLFANETLPRICWTAHQCHGAIGFTWEHGLHFYTRRALSWRVEYGDAEYHRQTIGNAIADAKAG